MSHAVFDCKHCGYSQPVDPVHVGSVFSCPTCSAVVMVTPAEPQGSGNPAEQVRQEVQQAAQQVANQAQQVAQQAQQTAQQVAHQATQQVAHQAQQTAHQAQQTVHQAAQQVVYQTQQTAQQTQQAMQQAAHEAQQQAEQAQQYIRQQAQQQVRQVQQQVQQEAYQTQQQVQQAAQHAQQHVRQAQQQVQQTTRYAQEQIEQTAHYAQQQTYQAAQQAYAQGSQAVEQAADQVAAATAQAGAALQEGHEAVQNLAANTQHAINNEAAEIQAQMQAPQAAQIRNPSPARQSGFDPAMVAYQTGAVSSPLGVPVASSKVSGKLPESSPTNTPGFDPLAAEHPLNVPLPDSRRSASVFGNVLLFAILYILFMTPYLLPYLRLFGLTDLTPLESGAIMSPVILRLVCSVCLTIIALFRGLAIDKAWLFIFPVIAGVVDFLPDLGLPSFITPALHALTLALGVLLSQRRSRRLTF